LLREITELPIRVRPHRHYPRGVKHKASSFAIFNREQRRALAFTENPQLGLT
jgi:hypothetical protein